MKSVARPLHRQLSSFLASIVLPVALCAQVESVQHNAFPNIDRRADSVRAKAGGKGADNAATQQAKAAREQAAASLRGKVKNIRLDRDELLETASFIGSPSSHLTGPGGVGLALSAQNLGRFDAQDRHRTVKAFIDEYQDLFGHRADVLAAARIHRDYVTAHNGLRTIVWQQTLDDIPIFESTLQAHLTGVGELVNVASRLLPDPEKAASSSAVVRAARRASPAISARAAVAIAARSIGEEPIETDAVAETAPVGAELRQRFRAPALLDAETRYVWLPLNVDTLRLAWEVICTGKTHGFMFRVVVDAESGEVQVRQTLTEHISNASYRVFTSDSPSPFSPGHATPSSVQPPLVSRTLVTTPALNTVASPNGWIDDGVFETRGNNVDAHTDINADNVADLPRPQAAGPDRLFDPALDLAQSPATYRDAAVVNLFYWCNFMHDKLYELGFTEAAGNFQNLNFGRGGLGNDAVQADAQDGSGVNNANFSTPPDGYPGRMQMYVFNGPTPDRDGDFDAEIILHEYTHGLSNRLVGGGIGMSALQSRGLGEGWSDFYSMALLSEPTDDVTGNYPSGGYATYQLGGLTENYYFGIRRYPYSTNLAKNPLTFKDIDPTQASAHPGIPRSPITGSTADEVHNMGEVWCIALWEARANLINKLGAVAGNQLMLQLVTDGMKLSPANPTFIQARDAILQADVVATGGANRLELWAAFAKRGMGFSAYATSSSTAVGVGENFDLPDDLNVVPLPPFTVTGNVGGPFTPSPLMYIIWNTGTAPISWSATKTQPWITLSPTSGVMAPGVLVPITATINPNANALPVGSFTETITFTNLTNGKFQTRSINLSIQPPSFNLFTLDLEPSWPRTGEWAFGQPTGGGGPYGYRDPYSGATGSNVFGINLSGNYAVTVAPATYLTAGPYSFLGRANSRLQFQRWLNTDALGWVSATIDVSRNGTTWTRVWGNGSTPITDAAWTKVQYDISAVADNQPSVYIRWGHQVTSSSAYPLSGWNIDDIEFLGQPGASAPIITTQPVSQLANVGDTVTFTVGATGLPVPGYQWNFNGLPIPGATSSILTLTNVQIVNAGTYTVTVSNSVGSVTSAAVTLSGNGTAPLIGTQPANLAIVAGQTASFNVGASGNPPLGYQWRRNGFAIAGATGSTLTIPGATRTDADIYDVLVGSGLVTTASQLVRLTVAPTAYPAMVAPDPAWSIQAEVSGGATGYVVKPLSDGRTYIAGSFTSVNGGRQTSIARILDNGTVDPTFFAPDIDNSVRAIAVQSDSKVVIGGDFLRIMGRPQNRIARLLPEGVPDPMFAAGLSVNGTVLALAIQPSDGKILVAGSFTGFGGSNRNYLVRLNSDGSVDSSFLTLGTNGTVNAIAVESSGKILIGGSFTSYLDSAGASTTRTRIARLNADGTLEGTVFAAPSGTVSALALQAGGQIVVAGSFTSVGGTAAGYIARLNATGSLDTAFTTNGGAGFNGAVSTLAVQADDKVIAGGSTFTTYAGATANRFARLNSNGSRDTGFLTQGFSSNVNAIGVIPTSGKILVGGAFSSYLSSSGGTTSRSRFARLNTNGTLDSGFNFTALRGPGSINALLPLPGGKMLVTGFFTMLRSASSDIALARLNADGTVDTTFNAGGSGANSNINAAVLQPDGKIVITGFFYTYNGATANNIARLNADGSLDPSFNPGAGLGGSGNSGFTLCVLSGGRIFVGGSFTTAGGAPRNRVAVFNADGSLNATFAPTTGANSTVYAAVAQPDGKVVIGGNFSTYNGTTVNRIARLNANGTLDGAFTTAAGTGASSDVSSIALLPDGRFVIGGLFTTYNGTGRSGVARLLSTGGLDSSFVPPTVGSVYSVLAQEDGKVVLRGAFNPIGGATGTAYLARLNDDGTRDSSFAAGGFMDSSLRPSVLVMRDNGQLFMQSNGYAVMSATQPAALPVIITPPASQFATFGGSATFTVIANSVLPVSYQWFYGATPIAGATGPLLALANLQLANSGPYSVVVTSELGSTASPSALLTVNKAVASVELSNLAQIYNGAPHPVTVTTTPANLNVIVTYDGGALPPVNAGSYAIVATIDDPNYAGGTTGTLVVAKAPAMVALGSLTTVYDGTPKLVTAGTTPANLNVTFTYAGSATPPTNAGSYAILATIDELNYAGAASGTLVIAKAPAAIVLGSLTPTYDGTPKPATATTTPPLLNVVFTYNGSPTPPTAAGSYLVGATIVETNYAGSATGTLTIAPATATIAFSPLTQSYDGTPKPVTVVTTPPALAFTLSYAGNSTPPTNPGSYPVVATITDPNYSGSASDVLTIVTDIVARHVSSLEGGIDGSLQLGTGENTALNGNAWISGDLLVPGTPGLQQNGNNTVVGIREGDGNIDPSTYAVTLNGIPALRYLVRRIDPPAFPTISAPPAPSGTRTVTVEDDETDVGDFTTIANLTVSGQAGAFAVPPGTYGVLTANGNSSFIFGVANSTTPAVYHIQTLNLNGNRPLQILGPVVLTLANGLTVACDVGTPTQPKWLTLNLAAGGLTLGGNATFAGSINAPSGTVTINGNSTLIGRVAADILAVQANGQITATSP